MSFRLRVTLLAAAAVAVAIVIGSVVVYVVVSHQLLGDLDRSLRGRAGLVRVRPRVGPLAGLPRLGPFGQPGLVQFVRADGSGGSVALPGRSRAAVVAQGGAGPFFASGRVDGVHVRVFTAPVGSGLAVQVARPLSETDHALSRIRWYLAGVDLS